VESMVGSASCGPFPLDVSDSICSASSINYLGSCVGSFSSSTCNVVFSYSDMWIPSTSTTVDISLVPPCGPCVLHQVLLGAPTQGGDMAVKFKLQALKSIDGSTIPHSIALSLDSMFFSLEKITMDRFYPSF
jgi:hypothetical protein